jgi:hypothetical protein
MTNVGDEVVEGITPLLCTAPWHDVRAPEFLQNV